MSNFIKHVSKLSLIMACLLVLPGCSVYLAATSPEQPDLSQVHPGADRVQVEKQLGKPIEFVRASGGDWATYTFPGPDEVDYRRAAAYALLDVVTTGLFELVSAPMETLQNEQHILKINYDTKGRVRSVLHFQKGAPLPKPQKLLGIEKEV